MRTLTQVWVFFLSLTFLFLLTGFQIGGRIGLFVAFLVSLFFIYATLHRSLRLFRHKLAAQDYSGNDPTGFLKEIQSNKLKFGFKKINVYLSSHKTPPLIWKSHFDEGYIILNSALLNHLSPNEIKLLALMMLSHLQNRSFLITPILSVINQSLFAFSVVSTLISSLCTKLFGTNKDILKSDKKFKLMADSDEYELGHFLNKLHSFEFHHNKKALGTEYFSILSLQKNYLNQYGIPKLEVRLKQMMGFSL